jgi:ribonuclease III
MSTRALGATLESALGYSFANPALLQLALTHRSYGASNNERLEFLGDAMLGLAVSQRLYSEFPALREGDLSRHRATLVRQEMLAEIAQEMGLGSQLQLGVGELSTGGAARPSILADALEAIIGAVFLDGGYEAAAALVSRLMAGRLRRVGAAQCVKDAKTQLQEWLQARKLAPPMYSIIDVQGLDHQQEFDAACEIPALSMRTTGKGRSRRIAEQDAANSMLSLLQGSHHE